jgi:hypothetical protein
MVPENSCRYSPRVSFAEHFISSADINNDPLPKEHPADSSAGILEEGLDLNLYSSAWHEPLVILRYPIYCHLQNPEHLFQQIY